MLRLGQPGFLSRPCNPNFAIRSIAPLWADPANPANPAKPARDPGGEFQGTDRTLFLRVGVCAPSNPVHAPCLSLPPPSWSTHRDKPASLGPALSFALLQPQPNIHSPACGAIERPEQFPYPKRAFGKLPTTSTSTELSNCTGIACCNRRRRQAPPYLFLSNRASAAPHRSVTRPRRSRCLLPSCLAPHSHCLPACLCFCSRSVHLLTTTRALRSTAQRRPAAPNLLKSRHHDDDCVKRRRQQARGCRCHVQFVVALGRGRQCARRRRNR